MGFNSRLTVALHILTWMALNAQEQPDEVITSDQVARSVKTNPVVIRRLLSLLGNAHLVTVQRGTGSGWRLARLPESITLLDVYHAVEQEGLFALHAHPPSQHCPVGRGIQPTLKPLYMAAESAMQQQLAQTTLADVLSQTLVHADERPAQQRSTEPSPVEKAAGAFRDHEHFL